MPDSNGVMDPRERYHDLDEAFRRIIEAEFTHRWTGLPTGLISHDVARGTVVIQPAIKLSHIAADGTQSWVQIPQIADAPVYYPGGGGVSMTFPYKRGDEAFAVFASRSIDKWWQQGGVQEQTEARMHDLSDAFVFPGFRSQPNALQNVSQNTLQIRTADGQTNFDFNPQGGGAMTLTAPNNPTSINGKAFNTQVQTVGMQASGQITISSSGGKVQINSPLGVDIGGGGGLSVGGQPIAPGGSGQYLPLTGGELSNPGNLIIDGVLSVRNALTMPATGMITFATPSNAYISADGTQNNLILAAGHAVNLSAPSTVVMGAFSVQGAAIFVSASGPTMPVADNSANFATTGFVKSSTLSNTGGTINGPVTINAPLSVSGNITAANLSAGASTIGGVTLSAGTLSGHTVNGTLNVTGGPISFSGYSISPINMNSYSWGFGWDGTVHWYVNGGDQGQTWMMTNQSGWVYLGTSFRVYDFQSNNNVNAAGSLFCGGCQIYNNGGWTYSPQGFMGPSIYANNGNVYAQNAVYVNYNSGLYWSNNGGWMYCPVGVWCANINTGSIQVNGNNINGCNILYASQSGWGGYGSAQFGWANGNWWAAQNSDAFYTYYNQGLSGGVYWSFCDERMKWNFGPVTRDCLASINAIELHVFDFSEGPAPQRRVNPYETRPDLFRWEDLPRKVKHIETGFNAQQLREIIPEAVPDPPVEDFFLSVDMRPLVATLIGAVQQLTKRLAAVEAR